MKGMLVPGLSLQVSRPLGCEECLSLGAESMGGDWVVSIVNMCTRAFLPSVVCFFARLTTAQTSVLVASYPLKLGDIPEKISCQPYIL